METEAYRPIDLHVHSSCSDGTLSPSELVERAEKKGLAAFALTDHDTVDGLDEAMECAARPALRHTPSGDGAPLEVVPGIELSTEYQGADIHIVGLYIDHKDTAFRRQLRKFVDSREERNRKMCELLRRAGVSLTYGELRNACPDSVITRAHYARLMLEKGYVKSRQEAFDRYIGDRAPCFVPREKITPAQAVELILQAGGAPVLAHPILYHMSDARLETLVKSLKESGLMGIEAIYSTYSPADERQIRSLAAKYDLLLSGGSDFHGANKPDIDMGSGLGNLYVPGELLSNIKKALNHRP